MTSTEELERLTEGLRKIVSTYELRNPMRTADFHGEDCACYRCAVDACDAAVNALPELLERVRRYESLIRALIENEPDDIVADGGHTVLDEWRYNARSALTQEPGHE